MVWYLYDIRTEGDIFKHDNSADGLIELDSDWGGKSQRIADVI